MGTGKPSTIATLEENSTRVRQFFDEQLVGLGLSETQIENQTLDQLENSLERVTEAMQHPEQFGTLRLKMTTGVGMVVSATADFHYEIGILPILLERKKRILERISQLRGELKVESLRDLLRNYKDVDVKSKLEAQLDGLEATARDLNAQLLETRRQQDQQLLRTQLEYAERTARLADVLRSQNPDIKTLQDELTKTQAELQLRTRQMARYAILGRTLVAFVLVAAGIIALWVLPTSLSWTWLLQHPRRLGLQVSGLLILAGIAWAVIDTNQTRRSFAVGSIILATLVGAIQLI